MSPDVSESKPLRLFAQLPEPEISEREILDMERGVLELVRLHDRGLLDADHDPGESVRARGLAEARRQTWTRGRRQFSVAAGLLVAAIASFLLLGLTQDSASQSSSEEAVIALSDARFEAAVSLLPLVEELDSSPGREVYQLSEAGLDVVMVFDQKLDL